MPKALSKMNIAYIQL